LKPGLPPSIGIIGGVGPHVDAVMMRRLLACQDAVRDQEVIPTVTAQFAGLIGDRTDFLRALGSESPARNPAEGAAEVARSLVACGARVLGIPCSTFHASPILDRFRELIADLLEGAETVEWVHMIDAAVADVREGLPEAGCVGTLSTNGTCLEGVYANAIADAGLEPLALPLLEREFSEAEQTERRDRILERELEIAQNDVHHAIYHPQWGIKSGREAASSFPTARSVLVIGARALAEKGAQAVILGCTELPLALRPVDVPEIALVDPLDSLARALVDAFRRRESALS
jgi:aspartate racemase